MMQSKINKGWVTFYLDTVKMKQKRFWKWNSVWVKIGEDGERNNVILNNYRLTKIWTGGWVLDWKTEKWKMGQVVSKPGLTCG